MDTGSSYTLINESIWLGVSGPHDVNPWKKEPLYLADEEERQPLGWRELTLKIQTGTVTLPCVILPAKNLAFSAVVGLDLVFFSRLQFDVSENIYWFITNKKHIQLYPFINTTYLYPEVLLIRNLLSSLLCCRPYKTLISWRYLSRMLIWMTLGKHNCGTN